MVPLAAAGAAARRCAGGRGRCFSLQGADGEVLDADDEEKFEEQEQWRRAPALTIDEGKQGQWSLLFDQKKEKQGAGGGGRGEGVQLL
jgi:hypothetical protein